MTAPLNLGITIRVNSGNSNAELGNTEQRVRGVGNAASVASQRMIAGMSSSATATQLSARTIFAATGSMTAGMTSAATATQIAAATMERSLRGASASGRASIHTLTESMAGSLLQMNVSMSALSANMAALNVSLSQHTNQSQNVNREFAAMARQGNTAAGMFRGLQAAIMPYVGIAAVIGISHKIIADTAAVQDLSTRLRTLTKEAGDYAQTTAYINSVADSQHKSINTLADSYAKLRNLQNSGLITEAQTKGMFEGLNNAASALGAGNEQLKQTFFGLAQGLSSGILKAEEFNQVTEPLPGLVQSLDKAAGLAAGGFRRLVNDQKVTSEMFANTLVKALHDYDGAAAAAGNNINAKFADIGNNWTRLITSLERPVASVFTPLLDGINSALVATREFNDSALVVEGTHITASSAVQGAWFVTSNFLHEAYANLGQSAIDAAYTSESAFENSNAGMLANTKTVLNGMIGSWVGFGEAIGLIIARIQINIENSLSNAKAYMSAMLSLDRWSLMGDGGAAMRSVVYKPISSGLDDLGEILKKAVTTDYIGNSVAAFEGAALGAQKMADAQKQAAEQAEQLKAKTLQAAAAAQAAGQTHSAASEEQSKAAKKAADEAKKQAEQHLKDILELTLSGLEMEKQANDAALQAQEISIKAHYDKEVALIGQATAAKLATVAKSDGAAVEIERQKQKIIADGKKEEQSAAISYSAASKNYQAALEQERIKLLQVTGQAEAYRAAQSQYDLNHNANYQLAKQTGPADAKVYEDVAKAELLQKNTQAADAYNQKLVEINRSTRDIGLTSIQAFDIANKGIGGLAGSFDNLIKSINTANDAIVDNAQKAKEAANDMSLGDKERAGLAAAYAKKEIALQGEKTQAELTGARQIAGAAAQMFGEKTAAAKAFHGIEIALSVASMAMKAKEMAVSLAATGTKLAEGAATMFAEGGFAGFAGVAAMMAVMAGLGFAGGGSTTGAPPKPSPDTGSVLGDSLAQSQSSDKIYNLLKDIHASEYAELRGINSGVNGLQVNFGTTVAAIFKSGGLSALRVDGFGLDDYLAHKLGTAQGLFTTALSTGISTAIGFGASALATSLGSAAVFGGAGGGLLAGSGIGAAAGPIGIVAGLVFSLISSLFSGGYRHVDEQGIKTDSRSIGDIMANQGVKSSQYNVIKTRGWDLFSDWTRYDTVFTELDAKVQKSLSAVFVSIGNSSLELAKALGGDLETKLKAYVLPDLSINLTNLNAEDANKKMQAVINTAWDNMIKTVFGPVIGDYQQVGEGMAQTASRLVAEMAVVRDALATANQTMPQDAIAVSDALVQMAGGLKQFQSAFGDYYDKFYTDAQKQAKLQSQLAQSLAAMNLVLPATRDGYRDLVSALDVNNAQDRSRYTLLMQLAGAADSYYAKLESAQQTYQGHFYTDAENLGNRLHSLSLAFNQLNLAMPGSNDGFRQLADGIDTSTDAGKTLLAQVLALSDSFYNLTASVVSAYQKAADLLKQQVDGYRNTASQLKAFSDSLLSGGLSSATPLQKYQQAQAAFAAVQAKLATGTTAEKADATGKLQSVSQAFLEASRSYNASSTAYLNDFAAVQAQLAASIDSQTTAANMAQAQLDQLTAQAKGIGLVKDAVDATTAAVNTVKAALDAWAQEAAASGYEHYMPTFEAAKAAASKNPQMVAMGLDPDVVNIFANSLLAEAKSIYGDKSASLGFADWKARADVVRAFLADAASYQKGFFDPNDSATPLADYQAQAKLIDGSHADGLAYVPFDGYRAELHKGERVLTARESSDYGKRQAITVKDTTQDDKRNTQAIVDAIMLAIRANAAGQDELRKELRDTKAKLDRLQRSLDKVKS